MPLSSTTRTITDAERRTAGGLPSYYTAEERLRLARIQAGRDLFAGRWRKFLIAEGRTAHVFKALRNANGREAPLLVTVNVLGLAAKKTADLLFLDPVEVTAPEGYDVQQEAIDRINRDSRIDGALYSAALTATYEAEAWLQVYRWRGKTIIAVEDADKCFPIGTRNPDGTYDRIEKRWVVETGKGKDLRRWLRKEIHTAGLIENELIRIDARGNLSEKAPLAEYYAAVGEEVPLDRVATGVDKLLILRVSNFEIGGELMSDFEGVDELVDQFTASVSQLAGVLAKHADPKMTMDEEIGQALTQAVDPADALAAMDSTASAGPRISAGSLDVIYTKEGLAKPEYLTWDPKLESALAAIDNWLEWMMAVIEMSPGLLGLRKGGTSADSWRKLRLEAANTLAKVARKKLHWDAAIRDAFRIAHEVENASPGMRYDFDDVDVQWHDGLPLDDQELTEDLAAQRLAGLTDQESAVMTLHGPEKGETVLARLKDEAGEKRTMNVNLLGGADPGTGAGEVGSGKSEVGSDEPPIGGEEAA